MSTLFPLHYSVCYYDLIWNHVLRVVLKDFVLTITLLLWLLSLFSFGGKWAWDFVFFFDVKLVVPRLLLFLILRLIPTQTCISLLFRATDCFCCIFKPLDEEIKLAGLKEEFENHTEHLSGTFITLINCYLWQKAGHCVGHLLSLFISFELQNFLNDIPFSLSDSINVVVICGHWYTIQNILINLVLVVFTLRKVIF